MPHSTPLTTKIAGALARAGAASSAAWRSASTRRAHRGARSGRAERSPCWAPASTSHIRARTPRCIARSRRKDWCCPSCRPARAPTRVRFPTQSNHRRASRAHDRGRSAAAEWRAASRRRMRLDLGRDIAAVPGPIESPQSAGRTSCMRDGAHVITSIDGCAGARRARRPARIEPQLAGRQRERASGRRSSRRRVARRAVRARLRSRGAVPRRGDGARAARHRRVRAHRRNPPPLTKAAGARAYISYVHPRHVYVHVPFCARRCAYCDFSIAVRRAVPVDEYVDGARARARDSRFATTRAMEVDTLYFGGGTPSRLGGDGVARASLAICDGASLARPAPRSRSRRIRKTSRAERSRAWRDAGVNRVSLGAQSFDDAFCSGCIARTTRPRSRERVDAARARRNREHVARSHLRAAGRRRAVVETRRRARARRSSHRTCRSTA